MSKLFSLDCRGLLPDSNFRALAPFIVSISDLRMKERHFRDLKVWQRSMALACGVYGITAHFPQAEKFGLTQQMRRAAVSVPSNIAEGRGRRTNKSFALFLSQARGSLNELETQLELFAVSLPWPSASDSAGSRAGKETAISNLLWLARPVLHTSCSTGRTSAD